MTYQAFLERVQARSGLASADQAERAVTAMLEALRDSLADGGIEALPQELRDLLPSGLAGAAGGQPGTIAGASDSSNPQLIGETRAESGGESTAESGQ